MEFPLTKNDGKCYKVIGMMSGTSLDGIDLVYCTYRKQEKWNYELHSAETYPYSEQILQCIRSLEKSQVDFSAFKMLEIQYSDFLGEQIQKFIDSFSIEDCSLISVHGHTIFHSPSQRLTVQITNLPCLAARLNIDVIGNFRELDVFRQGEGAPLAPFGEELFEGLVENTSKSEVVFMNLGGIANIGFRGKGADLHFCNLVFNYYSKRILNADYDKNGELGRQGKVLHQLINFFSQEFAFESLKHSLARQDFQRFLNKINEKHPQADDRSLISSFYSFLSSQLVQKSIKFVNLSSQTKKSKQIQVICTGGGAYNIFLMECIDRYIKEKDYSDITFMVPSKEVVEFKEAILFGLLGVKFLENQGNCANGIGGMLVKGQNPHKSLSNKKI